MTKFKEGDLVKIKQHCSGCIEGNIYPLHIGDKYGSEKDNLFARDNSIGTNGGGCSCQNNRELVEIKSISNGNLKKRHKYEKIYKREDGVIFTKNKIHEPGFDNLTIQQILDLISNLSTKSKKLQGLLNSHKNLKF